MGQLEGKVAVVIGGHSGFGDAIVKRFAAEGARVAIAARRADLVREAAAAVGGSGHSAAMAGCASGSRGSSTPQAVLPSAAASIQASARELRMRVAPAAVPLHQQPLF